MVFECFFYDLFCMGVCMDVVDIFGVNVVVEFFDFKVFEGEGIVELDGFCCQFFFLFGVVLDDSYQIVGEVFFVDWFYFEVVDIFLWIFQVNGEYEIIVGFFFIFDVVDNCFLCQFFFVYFQVGCYFIVVEFVQVIFCYICFCEWFEKKVFVFDGKIVIYGVLMRCEIGVDVFEDFFLNIFYGFLFGVII